VVVLLRVEGGGHTRPSYDPVSDDWRERAGGHNRDIESAEEVWRFLSQFRQAPPGG
jgi:poly(3-hydroxybutyrate) depolymerase